ncbi:DUF2125 domain-containing protein [Pontivivens ytuae]|uniref:DUF2125 domain-containing protein n=1 Tax=Pontivivens ytuae TaxID=2789856 RepID=A0A7S9LR61_9RHOB|nr:DUF2125 domain-containing protein [Pontivivens ytuae]QPH53777.1 DUF2125 domain-containing protein [Pontivivens ytuae]
MTRLSPTLCLAPLLLAAPAAAEVTPQDVLAHLLLQFETAGEASYDTVERADGGITLSGLSIDVAEADVSMEMPGLVFEIMPIDDPDYDVEVLIPEATTFTISVPDYDTPLEMTMLTRGLRQVFGGEPEAIVALAEADGVDLSFVFEDEFDADLESIAVTFSINEMRSLTAYGGVLGPHDFEFSAGQIGMKQNMSGGEDTVSFDLNYTGASATGVVGGPMLLATSQTLTGDDELQLDMTAEGSRTLVNGAMDGTEWRLDMSGGATELAVAISEGMFSYGGRSDDTRMKFASRGLPVPPIDATLSSVEAEMVFPFIEGETASDAGLRLRLDELDVAGHLWDLFDPQGVIAREPLSFVVDVDSKLTMTANMFDPEQMDMAEPPQMESASVNELRLTLAGAAVEAAGDFRFDPVTQVPVGSLDVEAIGINTLLENLTQIGLLGPDQVMPARMMLGLFAVPGNAPDTYTSRIEALEDGRVLANGMPLE